MLASGLWDYAADCAYTKSCLNGTILTGFNIKPHSGSARVSIGEPPKNSVKKLFVLVSRAVSRGIT
jgi:hypothetical protein